MYVIGIVGGIGAGKSTICQLIENLHNAYIIEADKVGHMVMMSTGSAYKSVVDTFGEGILNQEGEIDRKVLGHIVYNDPDRLNQLNEIVHKEVFSYLKTHVAYLREMCMYDFVIIEAALLVVDAFMPLLDQLWYVTAEEEVRKQRLLSSRDMSSTRIQQIMKQQPKASFYSQYADVIIDNNGDLEVSMTQINEAINKLWRQNDEHK